MKAPIWKNRTVRWGLLAAVAAVSLFAAETGATASTSPSAAADDQRNPLVAVDQCMQALVARITPAVVNITVASRGSGTVWTEGEGNEPTQPFGPQGTPFGPGLRPPAWQQPRTERDLGSGVLISPDGYVVTNEHVVHGAISIRVTTTSRDVHAAKFIGSDPLTDLAVIKIEGRDLPFLTWGDSSKLQPGQMVLAFGNPYGFNFSVTRGIVSALNRSNPSSDRYKPGEFIQTDAAINRGNSGGALVDASGHIVGINTFLISPTGSFSGMGFATPEAIARPITESIIRDGKFVHGFIGVAISDVTPENAKFFDMTKAHGALVTDVMPDSAGAKAGLQTGDVITALNGNPILTSGELQKEVVLRHAGESIQLQVIRDGKALNLPITLEVRKGDSDQSAAAESSSEGQWGLGLSDLTSEIRRQIHAPDDLDGAVVRTVRPGSPADNASLTPGDIIIEVNRKLTTNPNDVARELSSIPKGQDALVLVWSDGGKTFRVLHAWED